MNSPTSSIFSSVFQELHLLESDASLFFVGSGDGGFLLFPTTRMKTFRTETDTIHRLQDRLTRGRGDRPILSSEPSLVRTVLAGNDHPNVAILPILVDDVLVGSLNVGVPQQSSSEEMDALRACAERIGSLVRTSVPTDSVRRRNLQLNLINRLGRQDVWQMEPESFLDLAVVSIREGLDYYNVSIFMLEEDRSHLRLVSHAGAYRGRVSRGFRQSIALGIIGWVVRNEQMMLANDVTQEPNYLAVEGLTTASEICLPITIEGRVEGVLNVESDQVDAFDDGDVVALEALSQQVAEVIQMRRKSEAFDSLREEVADRHRFGDLLGRGAGMRRIFELIQTVSTSELPVLVRGETGTGKELVARAIHRESERHDRSFVAVNCAALPESCSRTSCSDTSGVPSLALRGRDWEK